MDFFLVFMLGQALGKLEDAINQWCVYISTFKLGNLKHSEFFTAFLCNEYAVSCIVYPEKTESQKNIDSLLFLTPACLSKAFN